MEKIITLELHHRARVRVVFTVFSTISMFLEFSIFFFFFFNATDIETVINILMKY